ncbi:MAG: DEAD/DEAH box helicase family protein, partial [Prevotella sp.]|nr:DEAD/DEAH box helicase family protein [Prevotella sp.]
TLDRSLVLNGFILSLFGVDSLQSLSETLKDPACEDYAEDGTSLFAERLKARLRPGLGITGEMLDEYDYNISVYTRQINQNRDIAVKWKYFQYLSLLFAEIYLDKYFTNKERLLADIRRYHTNTFNRSRDTNHYISEYTEQDLNKLAFWSATGSGKTLLMHVNILQYRHYLSRAGLRTNKTILITPNEGLTRQHISEFEQSGIDCRLFDKLQSTGLFDSVEIIEITKLAETDGDKTVAVGFFEGNNLVLVDEGHRGSSGDKWKPYRDMLSSGGFAFEYSATFGQAVGSVSSPVKRREMLAEYAKATLFDYSYRYFYSDGFGKDYQVLNIAEAWDSEALYTYLTACLLCFYEQLRLFDDLDTAVNEFLIERPLAVFVGSSVTATPTSSDRETSDVVTILHFFQRFISDRSLSVRNIDNLLRGTDGLVSRSNKSIFDRSFKYLRNRAVSKTAEQVYDDILYMVFHSSSFGAVLHLDYLRNLDGEIGMRVGNGGYFGVINVGDASRLIKKCAEAGLSTLTKDYTNASIFDTINRQGSDINVLIGSKKFTEGWSSWRVSTMGLMNVGRSEGSQIIQLFGRGVRLKGYKMSLKRSSALEDSLHPAILPDNLQTLETLNIFGIRADYMSQFKSLLEEMGLPANDSDYDELSLPILPVVDLGKKKLKYLKVKDGLDFKKSVCVEIKPDMLRQGASVSLNFYAKVQVMGSIGGFDDGGAVVNKAVLTDKHLSFIDWNKVYFDLIDYKNEKGWHNMTLSAPALRESIAPPATWYDLAVPVSAMEFSDYKSCVDLWQTIVTFLLKCYVERVYNNVKSKWMSENVETAYLDTSHPNFEKEYRILIHKDLSAFRVKILQIKQELADNQFLKSIQIAPGNNFDALHISGHLYQPLLYINSNNASFIGKDGNKLIEICPVPLNIGEKEFLTDIQDYVNSAGGRAFMQGKELYLLRNKSRTGIGFFDASGFYPDFILWLICGERQNVSFVDPKGILHLRQLSDSKIALHKNIKEMERALNDGNITLNSYIIANTPLRDVMHWAGDCVSGREALDIFNEHHVYFQTEQRDAYIGRLLLSMSKD